MELWPPHLLFAALEMGRRSSHQLSKPPIAHLLLGLQPCQETRAGRTTASERSPLSSFRPASPVGAGPALRRARRPGACSVAPIKRGASTLSQHWVRCPVELWVSKMGQHPDRTGQASPGAPPRVHVCAGRSQAGHSQITFSVPGPQGGTLCL